MNTKLTRRGTTRTAIEQLEPINDNDVKSVAAEVNKRTWEEGFQQKDGNLRKETVLKKMAHDARRKGEWQLIWKKGRPMKTGEKKTKNPFFRWSVDDHWSNDWTVAKISKPPLHKILHTPGTLHAHPLKGCLDTRHVRYLTDRHTQHTIHNEAHKFHTTLKFSNVSFPRSGGPITGWNIVWHSVSGVVRGASSQFAFDWDHQHLLVSWNIWYQKGWCHSLPVVSPFWGNTFRGRVTLWLRSKREKYLQTQSTLKASTQIRMQILWCCLQCSVNISIHDSRFHLPDLRLYLQCGLGLSGEGKHFQGGNTHQSRNHVWSKHIFVRFRTANEKLLHVPPRRVTPEHCHSHFYAVLAVP